MKEQPVLVSIAEAAPAARRSSSGKGPSAIIVLVVSLIACALSYCDYTPAILPPSVHTASIAPPLTVGCPQWDRLFPGTYGIGLRYTPDGQKIAVFDNGIALYDLEDKRYLWCVDESPKYVVVAFDFAPDGQTLALAEGIDPVIQLRRTADGELIGTLAAHNHMIRALAYAPDGQTLASVAPEEGVLRLWDLTSADGASKMISYDPWQVDSADFAPDGETLAVLAEKQIELWETETWSVQRAIKIHSGFYDGVRFSPDGKSLLVWGLGQMEVWRVADGQLLHQWDSESPDAEFTLMQNADFSSDGRWLGAIAVYSRPSRNGKSGLPHSGYRLRFWRVGEPGQWELVAAFDGNGSHHGIAFAPDAQTVALDWGRQLRVWDVETLITP